MIPMLLTGVVVVAAIGVPAIAAALLIETARDRGRRCASPRTGTRRARARAILRRARKALAAFDLWQWVATFEFAMPPAPYVPGPIVTDAEVREEDERLAAERPAGWDEIRAGMQMLPAPGSYPYPELRPTVLPRDRGDGHIIIDQAERLHVLPAAVPPPVTHPTLYDLPVVPRYAPEVAHGVDRCELNVDEAERRFALAHGPDGCEET